MKEGRILAQECLLITKQVNRLTRELTLLRAAQNASVVSNTSSTSAGLPDSNDHNANHLLSGPSHPTPSQRRHHRSSSGASGRSIGILRGVPNRVDSNTFISPDRDRGSYVGGLSMSRQNSTSNRERDRRSQNSSPAPGSVLSSSYTGLTDQFPLLYSQRPVPHRELSGQSERGVENVMSVQTSGRYEEMVFHRQELEAVKRENEGLRRRIRELERGIRERDRGTGVGAGEAGRGRRGSDISATGPGATIATGGGVAINPNGPVSGRGRSESVSTSASVGVGGVSLGAGTGVVVGREREREKVEEEVRVGESASNSGITRQFSR